MESKVVALLFAMLSIGSMVAIPGLSVLPRTAYALDIGGIVDDILDQAGVNDGNDDEEDDEEDNNEAEAAATEEEDQSGDDNQDIDQSQTQSNEQDAEVDQDVDQASSQDETNVQANELDTGDNTATVAQSNKEDQDVDADADISDSSANAASEADAEDDDHIKAKKSHVSESDTTSAESQADAIIDATAEATGIQGDQSNTATVRQNSSISGVDLSNNVAFGDDTNTQIAVPISDIDQRAANLAEQRAANLDVEENEVLPYGFTVSPGGEVVDCFPPSGATPPPFCD